MAIVCGVNQIDSNVTGTSYAEEACFKQLDNPVWRAIEANSYSQFGADVKTVARQPINPTRQQKRGRVTDFDAQAGFNMDITKGAWVHLMQGFFFANARQRGTTAPLNGNKVSVTSIKSNVVTLSAGIGASVGSIIKFDGFNNAAIDGKTFTASAVEGTTITVTEAIPDVAAPPATAALQIVGEARDAAAATVVNGVLTIDTGTALSALLPGEWVYIQGTGNKGFARVASVVGTVVTFDRTSFAPIAKTGHTVFYLGTILRSESDPNLIKRRTYQLERTLGKDQAGTQAEYITGAVPNQFTLNIPSADKMNADFTFVAGGKEHVTGLQGLKPGTRIPSAGETAYNTSSNVVRMRLTLSSDTNSNAMPLFGYATDANIAINNNVTANKAIGTIGAFDASAGNFEATGNVTAYFTDVAAIDAVVRGVEAQLYTIAALENQGIVFDMPSITLGGGQLAVELNRPITVPLSATGAQSKFGHTLLMMHFPYLPDEAMPS